MSDSPDMTDYIVDRLHTRRDNGVEKYGQPLYAWDGRNTVQDALEETLDLAAYLAKLGIEREQTAELLLRASNFIRPYAQFDDLRAEMRTRARQLRDDVPRIGVERG